MTKLTNTLAEKFRKNNKRLMWAGIGLFLIGVFALVFPGVMSLTVELMIGWILLLAGLISLFNSFSHEGTGPFFGSLLVSLLTVTLGVYFLFHPGIGLVVLSMVIAGLLIVEGATKIVLAFDLKPTKGWVWLLLSALASIVLGIMIASGIPTTSFYIIGVLIGINFLFAGLSTIMLSRDITKAVANIKQTFNPE